ncbi:hypothetical protein ACJRO7_033254 [Eucalyptus globulus]|uniref:Uncharacterized protein n=1 Tax=Eucalyptus globulus TaxID=34317 RepID=A0ABD3JLJ9_EUCGL
MTIEFKVEVVAEDTIRPSSPTPDQLKNFKFSVFDQLSPILYTSVLFFYTSSTSTSSPHQSSRLKSSLSKVLSRFYPLVGRIKDNLYIDCDDSGAEFIEAKIYCPLSRILDRPFNTFGCDGLAVGVCISHKIADTSTLSTFIKGWSTAALLGEVNARIEIPPLDMASAQCTTRRYVLNPTEITPLAAVLGLMWRCVARASKKNDPGWRSLSQAVNLRVRLPEPLQETMLGNLVGVLKVEIQDGAEEVVSHMREAKREYSENFTPRLSGGGVSCMRIVGAATEYSMLINSGAVDFLSCSSWCSFGLYEAADFGWGRPAWVSFAGVEYKNVIVLVDARDGDAVEVWMTLSQADMDALDADEELLRFACVNPSVSGSSTPREFIALGV